MNISSDELDQMRYVIGYETLITDYPATMVRTSASVLEHWLTQCSFRVETVKLYDMILQGVSHWQSKCIFDDQSHDPPASTAPAVIELK